MPKILILSAGAGAGHVRAGDALAAAFRNLTGETAEHVDVLTLTSRFFARLYAGGYLALATHAPDWWGCLYRQTDHPLGTGGLSERLVHWLQAPSLRRIGQFITERAPDALVCTHFLPAEIAGWLRQQNRWAGLSSLCRQIIASIIGGVQITLPFIAWRVQRVWPT